MTLSSQNVMPSVFDAVVTHAQSLGIFDVVYRGEPKAAPANGLTCAVYANGSFTVVSGRSGLASVAKKAGLAIRIHTPMLQEPISDIDPTILGATEQLLDSMFGDFTLGATAAFIDIFGAYGEPVSALPGYITIDSKLFRVMVITLPIILNSEATENG